MRTFYLLSISLLFTLPGIAQPALDRTFADTGVATLNTGEPLQYFNSATSQILLLPNGDFYVLQNGGSTITKIKSSGAIDLAYGFNGHSVAVSTLSAAGALQPDGKVVITGNDSYRSNDFALTRVNADGTLDRKFGTDGYQFSTFSDPVVSAAVALQNDGKILIGGTMASGSEQYFIIARYLGNGSPDKTFGTDGYQIVKFEMVVPDRDDMYIERTASLSCLAVDENGNILAGGYASDAKNSGFAIARLTSSGNLDATFSDDGKQVVINSQVNSWASDILPQPGGKVIVAGSQESAAGSQLVAMQFSNDGDLENGFGTKGVAVTANPSSIFMDRSMKQNAVVLNGDIILTGYIDGNGWNGLYVTSLKANGKTDKSFGNNGELIYKPQPNSNISAGSIAIQNGNRLLIGGTITYTNVPSVNSRFAVLALNNTGEPVTSFGNNGLYTDDFVMGQTVLNFSLTQPDGKIVTGGYAWNGVNNDFLLARYTVAGKIDPTFNSVGTRITDMGGDDKVLALWINPLGQIMAYGKSDEKFAMGAYTLSGAPSNIQSGPGTWTFDPGQPFTKIAVQGDGKIVLAGSTYDGLSVGQVSLVRLNPNGTFDDTFDGDGKKLDGIGNDIFSDIEVALQPDKKIIIVGRTTNNGASTIVLVRYNPDGTRDNSFGSNGIVITNMGTDDYYGTGVKITRDGKITVSAFSQETFTNRSNFVVARFLADGNPDNSFGNLGVATADFNAIFQYSNGLAINGDGKIAVGGTAAGFAVAVFDAQGKLDKVFSGDGLELHQIGIGTSRTGYVNSRINQLFFEGDFLYATGTTYLPNLSGALARYLLPQSGALPVTLVELEGKLSNKIVYLDWKFAADTKVQNFVVERSPDGIRFTDLSSVDALGPFNLVKKYASEDDAPMPGINYYRLRVVESNGKFTYSNIVLVKVDGFNKITVFPNPSTDHIYFNSLGGTGTGQIEIFDILGKRLRVITNVAANGRTFINVANLPAGSYSLKYTDKNGITVWQFVKQ